MRTRRLSTIVAAAFAVTALATGITVSYPASSSAADASGIQRQAWLYPGSPGESQCTAPAEYRDDRVKSGALKPEYWYINSDGTLHLETTAEGLCNAYSTANVADLKAHSASQYPTVSGMTASDVRALVSSSTKRSNAVSQLTTLITNNGLSGVDVDFEDYWSWSTTDFSNYKKFLQQLASSLHAQGKRLQVDAPAMTEDASFYDYAQVIATGVDELAIMAYDEQYDTPDGARCLPITPYDWLATVTNYAKSKVPDTSRLVMALPSYGYSAPDPCDLNSVNGNIQFSAMKQSPGFSSDPATVERRRDPSSGEIRWTSGGVLYDYVDSTAMDRKLAVLADLGITKVSVWSLGGGNPWFTS
ncbi:glycosyl hydrolase family 18 protein [Streptomyces sp. NPDC050625]|uniref:glycosyl hydrolase family 18 protein n=1 Tax=Streptomyces sp. NPDC050625 TaxID=3154629 RepID=UPI003442F59E